MSKMLSVEVYVGDVGALVGNVMGINNNIRICFASGVAK